MRKNKFIIIVFATTLCCMNLFAQSQVADSVLLNVQDKIYAAFIASFKNHNINELQKIQKSIEDLNSENQVVNYWIPYSKYYESIYSLKIGDRTNAKKTIDEGIDYLTKIEKKNAESYALLAHLENFSIQFTNGMSVTEVSKNALENARKALELDAKNPRAWYVMACSDYYKPKQYGGGKECEKYLFNTINSYEKQDANPQLPTWGVSDAYALLIGYYIENEDKEKAKEIFKKGIELFPHDYMISQYAEQLK